MDLDRIELLAGYAVRQEFERMTAEIDSLKAELASALSGEQCAQDYGVWADKEIDRLMKERDEAWTGCTARQAALDVEQEQYHVLHERLVMVERERDELYATAREANVREDRATAERDLALDKLRVCEEFCAIAEKRAAVERANVVSWLRGVNEAVTARGAADNIERGDHEVETEGGG